MNRSHKESCGLHCLQVKDLTVTIGARTILDHVALHAHCGELTAIIGRNGAGKSTLIKTLVGELAYTGSISFSGHGGAPTPHRPRVGYAPQSLALDKSSPTTVRDMMLCYTSRLPCFFPRRPKTVAALSEHLARFGASELMDKRVGALSGGELQRVLLALATVHNPDLVLLDEPVSGVDSEGLTAFHRLIDHLREQDMITLLISHDLAFVRDHADRVILLDGGRVAAHGTPQAVFETKAFAACFGVDTRKEAGV